MFGNSLITAFVERWKPETHTSTFHGVRPALRSRMFSTTLDCTLLEMLLGVVPETSSSGTDTRHGSRRISIGAAGCHGGLHYSVIPSYHSLYTAPSRDMTDITECMPLLLSWIYHRFPFFSPGGYNVVRFPLASRLTGLGQQSRDHHDGRIQSLRRCIDALTVFSASRLSTR
ncbi:hypothetical protein AHAS_Ahas03G0207900 [Arachis hypogaea]